MKFRWTILALTVLGGCEATGPRGFIGANAPPGAPEGTCWATMATPAVVQTITRQVLVRPASYDLQGNQVSTAQYRTETRQEIVEDRKETWFETPCPDVITPEFVASLQRALIARGVYTGPVTGVIDQATRNAIRTFQRADGVDSGELSLAAAQRLGLARVSR